MNINNILRFFFLILFIRAQISHYNVVFVCHIMFLVLSEVLTKSGNNEA